jgi:RNA polymerase-associated protein CTR9
MEELRKEAEKLAEDRRRAREQVQEWTKDIKMDSDDEKVSKPRKPRKGKADGASGDEAEPKKKRRSKLRKNNTDNEQDEDQGAFSEDEDPERLVKKVSFSSFSPMLVLTPS